MNDNYAKLANHNLEQLYTNLPADLAHTLPARQTGQQFEFRAFGEPCVISPTGIALGDRPHGSVLDILISLYALNARPDACVETPLIAFKEVPNSMPYGGAFSTHTEQLLVPYVVRIKTRLDTLREALDGGPSPAGTAGDFSLLVQPLPKIKLCYVFYEADEDFPASVTCLFSHNAPHFLPVDGLADVGEYTSRKIIALII